MIYSHRGGVKTPSSAIFQIVSSQAVSLLHHFSLFLSPTWLYPKIVEVLVSETVLYVCVSVSESVCVNRYKMSET